ncbi:MAG TPA: aminoglycoside 6-adenylyltransferase [Anaerolineales bacterium]|nr:aminoglycoside 6-adenylyltransferase [Anaerolineales bacterium]
MKKLIQTIDFIEDFMRWATKRKDIRATALVGSYAREELEKDSDVDLVIITETPQKYISNTEWTRVFGKPITKKVEEYGKLTSLRIWYENGLEIEYGFATRDWTTTLKKDDLKRIKEDGLRVLFEKEVLLSPYETPSHKATSS